MSCIRACWLCWWPHAASLPHISSSTSPPTLAPREACRTVRQPLLYSNTRGLLSLEKTKLLDRLKMDRMALILTCCLGSKLKLSLMERTAEIVITINCKWLHMHINWWKPAAVRGAGWTSNLARGQEELRNRTANPPSWTTAIFAFPSFLCIALCFFYVYALCKAFWIALLLAIRQPKPTCSPTWATY